ncbi:MAG: restriction endonuclease subunit S [Saprospiraceae bacterium]
MVKIKDSHIPPGYKKTEVGVIPEEWEVKRLGECLAKPPKYGINAPSVAFDDSLPKYLRITDITEDGRYSTSEQVSVNDPNAENYFLQEGDIVFARTGASVGKSYLFNPKDGPIVFAGFLICFTPAPLKLLADYLAQFSQLKTYWNWVKSVSARSGQPGINASEYCSLLIPLPPLSEQRSIARVLSDVDGLLEALDGLIEKKRALKTAAMQQLLTGKKRLPGFGEGAGYKKTEVGVIPEDWEVKKLGELGVFLKGKGIKRDDVESDGEVPCIRYGEIYTRYENSITDLESFVPKDVAASAQPIRYGDILFAGSGETAEEIGKSVVYLGNEDAVAGGDIVILRTSNQNYPLFLGFLLNIDSVAKQKARFGQGDAVVHINADNLGQIKIPLPPLPEQRAIACVLSDMDAEIEALEARREKVRQLKQGMMQVLLTGKVRLVEEVPVGDKK